MNALLAASEDSIGPTIVVAAVALGVSCAIAHMAGRSLPGSAVWGILGPFGWVIAALRAIQEQLDDLRRAEPAAAAEATPEEEELPKVVGVRCPSCHAVTPVASWILGRSFMCACGKDFKATRAEIGGDPLAARQALSDAARSDDS